ncbi:MAG: acyltransferase [Lachnospiraceae bacterium]|nr:acyltransferase [Candidatus Minthocola equi]
MENSVPAKKERNYGIELLRLVLMFMVCVLHTCGQGGAISGAKTQATYNALWFLEVISFYAVDGFAIISGYTATGKKKNFSKFFAMWFQAFFYSFIVSLILTLFGVGSLTTEELLDQATPLLSNCFWYFTAYAALFVLSPLIDKAIAAIDEKYAIKLMIVIIVFFSIVPRFSKGDIFAMVSGYSAIWLIICYAIGALAKKGRLLEQVKTPILVAVWAAMVLITWLLYITGVTADLINYASVTMVVAALMLVLIFSRMKFKGTIISRLAPLAFGIYLFQISTIIWKDILKGLYVGIGACSVIPAVILALLGALGIFAAGLIVEFLRTKLMQLIRLPKFCDFLAGIGGRAVSWIASKIQ